LPAVNGAPWFIRNHDEYEKPSQKSGNIVMVVELIHCLRIDVDDLFVVPTVVRWAVCVARIEEMQRNAESMQQVK
jgi:hypothetical protein